MNISEMVARNARTFPNRTALVERSTKGPRREITWKQFDENVHRIANALAERGIRKGERVVHWMMNSINWLEAYCGILRTGAWAVPLNFRFSSRDLEYCVKIAEPKAIIMDEEFVEKVEPVRKRFIPEAKFIVSGRGAPPNMERFDTLVAESSSDPLDVEIGDEDPASLYFTSGTTGAPKPILLTHKNLECAAITEVAHGLRRPEDTFVILKPLYHTGDKIHWLASLILGGRAVIQRDKITPRAIFEVIHEERGTVAMLLVPWILDTLEAIQRGELRKKDFDLSCWRLILLGAQPVPPSLIKRWKEMFPEMLYEVNYGLTEASGPGCIHLGVGNQHKVGSIGKAGFNWEARLVNGQGEDMPRGETGEIVVKGNGVMKEYYHNPEKTAETIRSGWLYTGDMGRMDEDGFIWVSGRKKDVIISGGENIYPAEIEEILQSHPKIHDVAVISLPDERLGEVVVAVIELRTDAPESIKEDIEAFCRAKLPKYKRPRQILYDKVLRNPLGKIEKIKIRENLIG